MPGRGSHGPAPVAAAVGLGLALLLVLVGCSSSGSGSAGDASDGNAGNTVTADGTITLVAPARRGQPIALAGNTVDGGRLDLATYRGKTVVLNVWGSWCSPCRKEAPDLQAASTQLSGQGVAFVGLSFEDTAAKAAAYQTTFGVTYPSLLDDGTLLLALRGAVAPKSVPSTLVLDTAGRIAARITGRTTKATLVDLVHEVQTASPS